LYKIDISFLDDTKVIEGPLLENQIRYNNIYNNLITNYLHSNCDGNSGCCDECDIKLSLNEATMNKEVIEVRCEGLLGNNYCELKSDCDICISEADWIIVAQEDCIEIANVFEVGEIVKFKMKFSGAEKENMPYVLRKLDENDWIQYKKNLEDEKNAEPIFKSAVEKFGLSMKLVAIHYQFDRKKLYFYYTSDGRVDFRELAKDLAAKFKTRIELRQIGVRDEAKRVGGLGTCGREFCCASFLNNFKRITTQIANDQNLSSNMSKLSGPCGKLKCCLSFELE
jgi:cell fate regulator YaaT (PSP1 superfamily)